MKVAVVVIIGFFIGLTQNVTCSYLERRKKDFSRRVVRSGDQQPSDYVKIEPGSTIYFHAIKNGNLMIGPKLWSNDMVTILTLEDGTHERLISGKKTLPKMMNYSVLKSGVLVPKESEESQVEWNQNVYKSPNTTFYVKGFKGILIPINLLYSKAKQRSVIDAEALLAKRLLERETKDFCEEDSSSEVTETVLNDTDPIDTRRLSNFGINPDKTCNGEITLFILKSNGELQRMPPDPYLPMGLQVSYAVNDDFLIKPKMLERSNDFVIRYFTGKNGDLIPESDNYVKMKTRDGDYVSFILSESGSLIPVTEEMDQDEHINYYFNGELIYKGRQFPEVFSNSEFVYINDQMRSITGNEVDAVPEERNSTKHSIRKRSLYPEEYVIRHAPPQTVYQTISRAPVLHSPPPPTIGHPPPLIQTDIMPSPPMNHPPATMVIHQPPPPPPLPPIQEPIQTPIFEPPYAPLPTAPEIPQMPQTMEPELAFPSRSSIPLDSPPRMHVRNDLYVYDEKGIKIPLIPELTELNDIILYKLTCKGNLVRYPPCKEPDYGFEIHFQLLLDEFILVPVTKNNRPLHMTYILQENGDLIPSETNENTFKKAPGSLIYFMLGKNNVLFPVQQKVDLDGSVTFYYQDYYLLKLKSTENKPLHFSTVSCPLFAFFNGVTVIASSSKPRLSASRGSNWRNPELESSNDSRSQSKDIFLTGPNGELIRIAPFRTKTGSTVIYEMDQNGILYRSPKDKKRCIILRSYIVLKEGIFLPSNDTSGYMYMASKNGDMFPYIYPDGKLEAPPGESMKYLLCEKGILLPIVLEVVDNHICYFFRDVVVYKERVYCKDGLNELLENNVLRLRNKDDCENAGKPCEKLGKAGVRPFTTSDGKVVYYEMCDSVLKRHPPDSVPTYMCYTMGSFEIQPDGSLFQIRYQDPDDEVVNLMLKPNGDLLEDSRNVRSLKSNYYILDVNGNLIAVEGRKTRKNIYFYKNHDKVCRVKLADSRRSRYETKATPLGRDPMKLMDDPEPEKKIDIDEPESVYIPIPLKSLTMPEPSKKSKCQSCNETMALELEINDEIIEEIKNWAAKCDKLLSRRDVEQSLTEALQGLNVSGLVKEGEAAG